MDSPKLVSAARPPLPLGRKKATGTHLPGALHPSPRLLSRTVDGMMPGIPSMVPQLLLRKAGLSPSRPALSPYAAVMPPKRSETSRRTSTPDISSAHKPMQLQSSATSHRIDTARPVNLREGAVAHRAATPHRGTSTTAARAAVISQTGTGTTLPQVRATQFAQTPAATKSRASAAPQQLVGKDVAPIRAVSQGSKSPHPVSVLAVSGAFPAPHLRVVSDQVRERYPAAVSAEANGTGRKRRLDAAVFEHLAKKPCTRVDKLAAREADPDEGREKGDQSPRAVGFSTASCIFAAPHIGVASHQFRDKYLAATASGANGCGQRVGLDALFSKHLAKRTCTRVNNFATREADPRKGRGCSYAQLERKRRRSYDISDEPLGKRCRANALVPGKRVNAVKVC